MAHENDSRFRRLLRSGLALSVLVACFSVAGVTSCGGDSFVATEEGGDASTGGTGGSGGTAGNDGSAGTSGTGGTAGTGGTTNDAGDAGAGGCGTDQKDCADQCVSVTDPATGCAGTSCAPCVLPRATATCSSDGKCAVGTCNDGFDDCNDDPIDGCEANTKSDPTHCGTCDTVCASPGGTAVCNDGICGVSQCESGKGDCDDNTANGCETELNTSVANCGFCDNLCELASATSLCVAGDCEVNTCDPDRANCDAIHANGCEVDLTNTVEHCGTCDNVCAKPDGASARCLDSKCGFGCDQDRGDCDGDPSNGCEADLKGDVLHCGSCPKVCVTPNGVPACVNSTCALGSCTTGWGDCNTNPSDGCETNTNTSVMHCGDCGDVCPGAANAMPRCTTGTCGFSCNAGYDNCDADLANGCETNLSTDRDHCGTCAIACSLPHATPACQSGVCQISQCDVGWADCNHSPDDGCEVNTDTEVTNCGVCGKVCSLTNATPSCSDGVCVVSTCNSGWGNCDGADANGCELNTNTSVNNCGACNFICNLPHATETCDAGTCAVASCEGTFESCDGEDQNGCEINTGTDPAHCGDCSNACSIPNAAPTCTSGGCGILQCNLGWGNCDGQLANGCEANLLNTPDTCGTCNIACDFPHAATSCVGGACVMGACVSGYANCDGDASNGCEAQLAVDQLNCGVCGHDCLKGACATSKCQPFVIAQSQANPWSIATDGTWVYWNNKVASGTIMRAQVTGGGLTTIASGQASPDGLAINATSVFWANNNDGTVKSAPLAGGSTPTTLATNVGSTPAGVAATSTHVYWTNWSANSVQRIPSGGGVAQLISNAGNNNPHRLATDGTSVWWTSFSNGLIRRSLVLGGGTTDMASSQVNPVGIAADASGLYWTNQGDGTVKRMALTGGVVTTLASGQSNPTGIAIDQNYVYWTNSVATGVVRRTLKAGGGTIDTLASNQGGPVYLAIDAVSIYWTNNVDKTVVRLAK